ncbi:UDP-N-acetylmuramoyl-L-alanyl-D-glutamate--2,6-diaminopimelate ligase [Brachybacterium huguangmaarense]
MQPSTTPEGTAAEPAVDPARPERVRPVALADLADALGARLVTARSGAAPGAPGDDAGRRVAGVTLDSRAVRPGDLWSALPGERAHGAEFAAQAASLGAVAALTDERGLERCRAAGLDVLVSEDPRRDTARAAALVYGTRQSAPTMIGVTGTNGKTSVTTMVIETLTALGRPGGVIGTAGTTYTAADGSEHRIATVRTTPESPEVHGILARMEQDGVQVCAMEVSSHAMVLHRADEVGFAVACFTNLTQDHLDFHGDMEHYFAAKAALFAPERTRASVICVDDAWGRRLAAEARAAGLDVTTYAVSDPDADVRAVDLRPGSAGGLGTDFVLERRDATGAIERIAMTSPLPGRHYVANTLAVALLLEAIGVRAADAAATIASSARVPGRMELVAAEPVRGVVDYSHTEDSLAQALTTLRALPGTQRLLVVMGAGGDRDRAKRPLMGAAAARLADVVIVTDDNPRSEDPAAIRAAILSGITTDAAPGGTAEVHEVAGRGEAIALAARLARPGDTVLVSGKGAETTQEVRGIRTDFDDRVHLRAALAAAGTEGHPC